MFEHSSEVLFIVDASSGTLSHVNAIASKTFELPAGSLAAVRASALVPELADLTARRFDAEVRTRAGVRRMDVSVEALTATVAGDRPAVLVSLGPQVPAVLEEAPSRDRRSERLESLWSLVVRRGLAGSEHVRAILHEALRGIGLEHATIERIDRGELVVEFAEDDRLAGERVPIDASLGRRAVAGSGTFAVLDTELDPEFASTAGATRAFLASAFRAGEERWVLTFASTSPRAHGFTTADWEYVDLVVEAAARAIERRENDERIERLAYVDGLTALPNRIALHGRLDGALRDAARSDARAAVLFLDIDGFKNVNDTVGHRGGDIVLAEVAHRLRGTLRRDEYIGRLGGDEFAIVMPCIADRAEIESIAQRIGGVLTFPFAVDGYRFSLSASIGVAIYPDDASGRDELLACADAAMYSAKDDGGSRIRFCDAPDGPSGVRDGFGEFGVRSAFASEARDVGYVLCYQPILDARTDRITAAEALIRRVHPVHGLLAPERGWSIADDEAGRRALDRWVLREATSQARAWAQAGTPIRIDVNLAAFDPAEIEELAADGVALDARRVRIEMTAKRFADDDAASARMATFVDRCREADIGFVLDGFDGGLAGLPALAHLPIDAVKLARPLVKAISASRTAQAIVEGSIVVARSLGWSVVAKGVETAEQFDALVAVGCDAMQGFYVAHPMTAADFGTWLVERDALAESRA